MRVLVIGSGAREHALCVALHSDPAVRALSCAPGNPGTRSLAEPLDVDPADPAAVAHAATGWSADLVVIGPEVPLVTGAADAVREAGIACFGPSREAARLVAWRKLQSEARRQLLRVDARARAEEKAKLRSLHRSLRDQPYRTR